MPLQTPKKTINVNKLNYVSEYLLDATFDLNKSIPGVGDLVHYYITNKVSRLIQNYRTFTPPNPEAIIEDFKYIFDIATLPLQKHSFTLKKHTRFLSGIKIIYDFLEDITKKTEQIKTPDDIVGRGPGGFVVRRKHASNIIGEVFHVSANHSREDSVTHTGTWWVLLEDGTYKLVKSIGHDSRKNTYNGGRNAKYITDQLQNQYKTQGIYTPKKASTELPKYFDKTFLKDLRKNIQQIDIEYPNKDNTLITFFDQPTKSTLSNDNNPTNIVAKNEKNNNHDNNTDDPESHSEISNLENSNSEDDNSQNNNSENNSNIPINIVINNNNKHIDSSAPISLFLKKSNIKAIESRETINNGYSELKSNSEKTHINENSIKSKYSIQQKIHIIDNSISITKTCIDCYIHEKSLVTNPDFITGITLLAAIVSPTPFTISAALISSFIYSNDDFSIPLSSIATMIELEITKIISKSVPQMPFQASLIGNGYIGYTTACATLKMLGNGYDLITNDLVHLYNHLSSVDENPYSQNMNDTFDNQIDYTCDAHGKCTEHIDMGI